MDWLEVAMSLKGAALSVGVILWYFRGVKKSISFKIGIQDIADRIHKSWLTTQRALSTLEEAKLITIEKHPGRKHLVTIQTIAVDTTTTKK